MKANVLRREFPSGVAFQTPEEKIERITGSISTKISLKESSESRHGPSDRNMYTTNTTLARNRLRGHPKPLEQRTQQRRNAEKDSGVRVKQMFYWGHERKSPPRRNTSPSTKTTSQFSYPKAQFDPRFDQDHDTKSGKLLHSRQLKASSQGGSCPTQIYSKFKSIHSEKMNRTYPQQVNINDNLPMDPHTRRRTHLQPLMLGYDPDKPRLENTSYHQPPDRAPSSWKSDVFPTSSARSTAESHSNYTWPMNMDVEDRHGDRWSPLQNTFDMVQNEKTNSISHEDRWDFTDWPAPPPNSVTPSSFEMSQPPPNTPNDWW
ncbi:uncharacterized protein LOC121414757 [Lytechinus variegatus]|uniref:uncharacterized protein LOC121414757 n=1 Tax=Lytechinus variegatus TaxID=7654 RepID=UPI001BB0FF1F|nr:uncharacterized protein LOC121414757 [Lytechinus variegatus]XP_041463754.1 uncharacterized protein LOC121414757 [Lytechinus variegatus]